MVGPMPANTQKHVKQEWRKKVRQLFRKYGLDQDEMHDKMSSIHEDMRAAGQMAPQAVDEAPPVAYDSYDNNPADENVLGDQEAQKEVNYANYEKNEVENLPDDTVAEETEEAEEESLALPENPAPINVEPASETVNQVQIAGHMPSLSEMGIARGAPPSVVQAPVAPEGARPPVQPVSALRNKPDPRPAMNGPSGGPWV